MVWWEFACMCIWILAPLSPTFLSVFPYWTLRIWFLYPLVKENFINILTIFVSEIWICVFRVRLGKAKKLYYVKFGELRDLKGIYGGFLWLYVLDWVWRKTEWFCNHFLMISTLFEKRLLCLKVTVRKVWSASISSRHMFWQALFQRFAWSPNACSI